MRISDWSSDVCSSDLPGANVIAAVDQIRALIPELQAEMPSDVKLRVATDSTNSIRASLLEIEITLLVSMLIVVLVVSAFLRDMHAPVVSVIDTVLSLPGPLGRLFVLGFTLHHTLGRAW